MKKSIIKRRKRVVAPINGQAHQYTTATSSPAPAAAPPQPPPPPPAQPQQPYQVAVDFTTSFRPSSSTDSNSNGTRKRSLAAMEDSERNIQSLLDAHAQQSHGDVPIEPSLLALGVEALGDEQKRQMLAKRKEELVREMRRVTEEMDACDRELEKLGRADAAAPTTEQSVAAPS